MLTPEQKQAVKRVLKNGGPHEWGYRDLTDGTFIIDDTPFHMADMLSRMKRHPIETAPKLGEPLLLWDARATRWMIGFWVPSRSSRTPGWWASRPGSWPVTPTHWMPLPEPPDAP